MSGHVITAHQRHSHDFRKASICNKSSCFTYYNNNNNLYQEIIISACNKVLVVANYNIIFNLQFFVQVFSANKEFQEFIHEEHARINVKMEGQVQTEMGHLDFLAIFQSNSLPSGLKRGSNVIKCPHPCEKKTHADL